MALPYQLPFTFGIDVFDEVKIVPEAGTVGSYDEVNIINSGLSLASRVDNFSSLNGTNFQSQVVTTGSVQVNSGSLGTVATLQPNSSVRIDSANTLYFGFDVALGYDFTGFEESLLFDGDVTFAGLRFTATDVSAVLADIWKPRTGRYGRLTVNDEIVFEAPISGRQPLRVVRIKGDILAYVGSRLLYRYKGWYESAVSMSVISSTKYFNPISVRFYKFEPRLLVLFGDVHSPHVVERGERVSCAPPNIITPGRKFIQAQTFNKNLILGTYTVAPKSSTILSSGTSVLTINDDPVLRE